MGRSNLHRPFSRSDSEKPALSVKSCIVRTVSVLIIVLLPLGLFYVNYTRHSVFEAYFVVPANYYMEAQHGVNPDNLDPVQRAFYHYDMGQPREAYEHFSRAKLAQDGPLFYKAITAMLLGEHQQAKLILQNLIESQGTYKDDAQWYLGLLYVNKKKKASKAPVRSFARISQ